jgi:hypothetical protein
VGFSVTKGHDGSPMFGWAGSSPMNKDDWLSSDRVVYPAIINDLNEAGTPNHNPDGTGNVDNHDFHGNERQRKTL